MKFSSYFAGALGQGAGQSFPSLNKAFQERVLKIVRESHAFAYELGNAVGYNLVSLKDQEIQKRLLELASETNNQFAYGLGAGIATTFSSMTKEMQDQILKIAYSDSKFAEIFGSKYLWNRLTLKDIDKEIQKKLLGLAERYYAPHGGDIDFDEDYSFGEGFACKFVSSLFRSGFSRRGMESD